MREELSSDSGAAGVLKHSIYIQEVPIHRFLHQLRKIYRSKCPEYRLYMKSSGYARAQ